MRRGSNGETDDGAPSPSLSIEGEDEEEDDIEEGEGESEGEDGIAGVEVDAATTSSSEVNESGYKRSRTKATGGKSSNKKSKKSRHVLFDETVMDNSEGQGLSSTSGGISSTSSGSSSSSAASSSQKGTEDDGYSSGGQRMRRHSIAY